MGHKIKRGQIITGYPALAKKLGLSVRNVRTAFSHLKSTGEVTVNRQSKFSIVTIKNYDQYQVNDSQADSQVTVNRQSSDNKQEGKNERMKEERNKNRGLSVSPEFGAFLERCRSRNVECAIAQPRYEEMREEFATKLMWWKEVSKCIDWMYDKGNKKITAQRLRSWMRKSVEFGKEKELKLKQEYRDKNSSGPKQDVKPKLMPVWEPPL